MSTFLQYALERKDTVIQYFLEHIHLTLIAVGLAIFIGVPIGILVTRYKKFNKPVIGTANIIQAIPSLALLGCMIPLLGIGSTPAIVMVALYSLLPIIKNTYTGLVSIEPEMLEAARGIGLTRAQILTKIQIPLALPMIMAGVRISAVTGVGLMTIAAYIGAGGLGYLVYSGIQSNDMNLILLGAIPACFLALCIDFLLAKIEKIVTPIGIGDALNGYTKEVLLKKQKNRKRNLKVISAVVIVMIIGQIGGAVINMASADDDVIVVGGKDFTEQLVLANIFADLIEAKTDLTVERRLNMGSQIVSQAIQQGDIDLYVEYVGTGLINVLDMSVDDKTTEQCYELVKDEYMSRFGIAWQDTLGFSNTFAIAMDRDLAEKYNVRTISDLQGISKQFGIGGTIEFLNREDALLGLKEIYGLEFKKEDAVEGSLKYTAIGMGEVDIISALSTEGLLKEADVVVLEDDKQFFPPYQAAPIIRQDTLEEYPELESVVNLLAGAITEEKMIDMNYQVDNMGRAPEDVAREFLVQEGLI